MINMKPALSILTTLFVIVLLVLAVMKIWIPEMIADDTFFKLMLTFGVLMVASVLMVLLAGKKDHGTEEKGE